MNEDKIYETSDYSIFRQAKGNRPISEKHVNEIVNSMQRYGVLRTPIKVNENMEVLDGQHRLEALRRMGEPVQFFIGHGEPTNTCRIINDIQRPWGAQERLINSAENGDSKAKLLLHYCDMNPGVKRGVIYEAYTKAYSNSKQGFHIELNDSVRESNCILQIVKELMQIGANPGTGTVRAIKQMIIMGAKPELLLAAVSKHGKTIIGETSIAAIGAAYITLTKVYNFAKSTNYVDFPPYASKEMKRRLKGVKK